MTEKNLAQVIKDNPGATLLIDNDQWQLYRINPYGPDAPREDDGQMTYEEYDVWQKQNILAHDNDSYAKGNGGDYNACSYGLGVLHACAELLDFEIEYV